MSGRPVQMPHVNCPACGGRAFARSIGKTSLTFREVYFECRNPDACGHRFVIEMNATRTIIASRFPTPLHTLPLTEWHAAANDRAHNDNNSPAEADAAAAPS